MSVQLETLDTGTIDSLKHNFASESKGGLPPYHTFEFMGKFFVFDTSARQFYAIDQIAYDFLRLCESCSLEKAKKLLAESNKYSEDSINSVYKEVSMIAQEGLFDSLNNYFDNINVGEEIQRLNHEKLRRLELIVTDTCNLACKYCYCSMNCLKKHNQMMSREIIRKGIDSFIPESKLDELDIIFFGGEPLLNKSAIKYATRYINDVSKVYSKKIQYGMTTNGTLIDDDIADFIIENNIALMVSLDGNEKLHDSQCPSKKKEGSFISALAGINKILYRRKELSVRATLISPFKVKIQELMEYFKNIGFEKIVIGPVSQAVGCPNVFSFTEKDYKELSNQENELLEETISILSSGKTPPYSAFKLGFKKIAFGNLGIRVNRCGAAVTNNALDTMGDYYPCHRFIGMDSWKVGNITKGLDNEKCKMFWVKYNKTIKDYCGICWAYPLCSGPCPWDLCKLDGTMEFSNLKCSYMKEYTKKIAYIFFSAQSNIEKDFMNDTDLFC